MGPAALQCKPGDERSAIGLRRQLLVQHVQEMESGLRAEGQHPEIIRVGRAHVPALHHRLNRAVKSSQITRAHGWGRTGAATAPAAVVELAKAVNSAAAAITDRSVALTPRTRGLVPRLNSVCEELLTGLAGMVVTRHLRRIQRIHIEQPRLARLSASEHRRCG